MTSPSVSDTFSPQRPHLTFLDGVRACAALFVVLHHLYINLWDIFAHHFPSGFLDTTTRWMIYGHFAVSVFIVLSGFSLMLPVARGESALRGGVKGFFVRRSRRILPPYYFALGLSLTLGWLTACLPGGQAFAATAEDIATHLLLIHNFSQQTIGTINGALWSIAVECQIYLFFPCLVALSRKIGVAWVTLGVVLVAYGLRWFVIGTDWAGLTPHYFALFAFGMMAAVIAYSSNASWQQWRERTAWGWLTFALSALLIVWCRWWGWEIALGTRQHQSDLLVGLCTMGLLITSVLAPESRLNRILEWKPLAFVGTFAYSIYLIHLPLLMLLLTFLRPLFPAQTRLFAVMLPLGVPLVVTVSYLFFLAAERPFISSRAKQKK